VLLGYCFDTESISNHNLRLGIDELPQVKHAVLPYTCNGCTHLVTAKVMTMAAMAPVPAARVVATAVLLTMAAVLGPTAAAALPGLNPYLLQTQEEAAEGVSTAAAT